MTEPKRYQIRTLQDIFNLPTLESMRRCLDELRDGMIFAREAKELVEGVQETEQIQWPEVSDWVDDGLKTTTVNFNAPDESKLTFVQKQGGKSETLHEDLASAQDDLRAEREKNRLLSLAIGRARELLLDSAGPFDEAAKLLGDTTL